MQAIYKPARANQKVIHFRSEAIIISSPSHFVLSAILRVEKMLARGGKNKTDIYIDIVKAFVNDSIIRVETYAKELLSAIAEGDMLRTYLTALRRLIKHIPINTISLRRKIADHLIEMERYAL